MKQFLSRSLLFTWCVTSYALWFLQSGWQIGLILFLPGILCFSLVLVNVTGWSSPRILMHLTVLEGLYVGGLGFVWIAVNHSGLVTPQTLFLVSNLLGAILAFITRLLVIKRSSDLMLVAGCGCVGTVLAVTCLLYRTLDQFLSQSRIGWYVYLALVAPFGFTVIVGLYIYLVHSFRLLVDELVVPESF